MSRRIGYDEPVKIGVISDTHDSLPEKVVKAMRNVDEIWHLGDVTQPWILDSLEELQVPVYVVAGNCDQNSGWPEILKLKRMGVTFLLVHIPLYLALEGVDVLLHGHTHVPRDEIVGGCRFINPGAVAGSCKGAPHGFGLMTLDEGGGIEWEQVGL